MTDTDLSEGHQVSDVKTILVVEDDADIAEFLVELLKLEKRFHILLATDGSQTLELWHRWAEAC